MERGVFLGLGVLLVLMAGSVTGNVFSVVKFPNNMCTGQNGYNGTCYTKEECSAKGGSESGTCASGFGVCCTFSMTCGSTSSENNTYFEQVTFTTYSGGNVPCKYTICPLPKVCRIKLDLNTFDITGPIAKSTATADKSSIGKCQLESMTISSPGMKPPPVICGINSGQHMFLDVSSAGCIDIDININTLDTTTSRTWSIKATQYECGDTMAGPAGCLQYHTGITGDIATFNWDLAGTTTAVLATTTHLADQHYTICFRREEGYCRTCFTEKFAKSFGVSLPATDAQSGSGSFCDQTTAGILDYIEIPGAQESTASSATSEFSTKVLATMGHHRICGLALNAIHDTAAATVCTHSTPFQVRVRFDGGEEHDPTMLAAPGAPTACETCPTSATDASGADGFYLSFTQQTC